MPLPERQLISGIRAAVGRLANRKGPGGSRIPHALRVAAGIGDDCAVLSAAAGRQLLVTTDFSLENIHFRRAWHPPESVGHRCLARGLSDIAAMGGEPTAAFLSLAVPADLPQKWVNGFLRGFLKLAKRFGIALAGGDTAQSSSGALADIVVLGTVPAGEAILRSTARAGDLIYVTGELGSSAAILKKLFANAKLRPKRRDSKLKAHFYPEPRIAVGRFLRENALASAMIDISDGLSTDLRHICDESGCGALIRADAIPRASGVELDLALHGGDDYELLFTARPKKRLPRSVAGVPITCIGEITRSRRVLLDNRGRRSELKSAGWQHFA